VFFDTSVIIAGTFSQSGASYVLLQLADIGLLDGRFSTDVRTEAERNVAQKLPGALPALRVILNESLTEASPPVDEMSELAGCADPKDVAILAAAVDQKCRFLVTLNARDFWPPSDLITVVRPGDLLVRLRGVISNLATDDKPG
jgi:putative PIN family toxin of toxin-antitoxin system